ncbi:MAG: acetylglutamate kinase [Candidatus Aenigmarchaeota archaeon]|nr:acetylglutamate kinase [Candidatus Aenigmarchaeota archaeon]
MESITKAHILVEAFHWAKKFSEKIVVIKYGGNAMTDKGLQKSVFTDISILKQLGMKIVVVHGGGPFIDEEMKKKNMQKKIIDGIRVTDYETLNIVTKVLKQKNTECVDHFNSMGIEAKDCTEGLISTKISNQEELGYVGKITKINAKILLDQINDGCIPIVSPLGKTQTRQETNINADTVAIKIAKELNAEKLTFLTNVDGIYIKGNFVSHLNIDDVKTHIQSKEINGGMIPKVLACIDALKHNVKKVHLINGTTRHSLLLEIFTDKGIGTEVIKNGAI